MVAAQPTAPLVAYWSASHGDVGAWATGRLMLQLVDPYPVLQDHWPGGLARHRCRRLQPLVPDRPPSRERAWVQAAIPSTYETTSDGAPAIVVFDFVPAAPDPT